MRTTKNMKDLRSKMLSRVYSVGAGGVDKYGSTNLNEENGLRYIQEEIRNKTTNTVFSLSSLIN